MTAPLKEALVKILSHYAGKEITLRKLKDKTIEHAINNYNYKTEGTRTDSKRFCTYMGTNFRNAHHIKVEDLEGKEKLLTIPPNIKDILSSQGDLTNRGIPSKKRKLEIVDDRPAKKQKVAHQKNSQEKSQDILDDMRNSTEPKKSKESKEIHIPPDFQKDSNGAKSTLKGQIIIGTFVWNDNNGIKNHIIVDAEKGSFLHPLQISYNLSDNAFNIRNFGTAKETNGDIVINDKFMLMYGQNMPIYSGDKFKINDITYRFEMSVL